MDAGQAWYYKFVLCKFCESSAQRRVGGVGKWTVTATQAEEKSQWRHDQRPIACRAAAAAQITGYHPTVDKLIQRPVRAGTGAPCGRCEPTSLLAGGGHASNYLLTALFVYLWLARDTKNH